MSVDDNYAEAIRKSAEEVTQGDKSEYRLKFRPDEGILAGIKYDFVSNTIASDTETWVFKTGGASGTTVATIVIVYTSSSREDISTVTRTV